MKIKNATQAENDADNFRYFAEKDKEHIEYLNENVKELKEIKEYIKYMPNQTFDKQIMIQSFDYHNYASHLKRYIKKLTKELK